MRLNLTDSTLRGYRPQKKIAEHRVASTLTTRHPGASRFYIYKVQKRRLESTSSKSTRPSGATRELCINNSGAGLLYSYTIKSGDSNRLHPSRHESRGLHPVGTSGLLVNNRTKFYYNFQRRARGFDIDTAPDSPWRLLQ